MSFHDLIRRKAGDGRDDRQAGAGPQPASAPVRAASEAVSGGVGFDPSEHSVKGVLAYVDKHPDEGESIYNAEASGKARSSLLSALGE